MMGNQERKNGCKLDDGSAAERQYQKYFDIDIIEHMYDWSFSGDRVSTETAPMFILGFH